MEDRPVNVSRATAAPVPLSLAGRQYRMSPLNDRDYGEFENWMRARPAEIAKETFRRVPDLTTDERAVMLREAMQLANELSINTPKGLQLMTSLDGASYLTWLGLRKCHPTLSLEEVKQLLTDPLTLKEALDHFDQINGLDDEPSSKGKKRGRIKPALNPSAKMKKAVEEAVERAWPIEHPSTEPSATPTDGLPPKSPT